MGVRAALAAGLRLFLPGLTVALLAGPTPGCSPGEVHRITLVVSGQTPTTIHQLVIWGTIGTAPLNLRYPPAPSPVSLPMSVGLDVAEGIGGHVALSIDAVAEDPRTVLASATASGELAIGGTLVLPVELGAPRQPDAGLDSRRPSMDPTPDAPRPDAAAPMARQRSAATTSTRTATASSAPHPAMSWAARARWPANRVARV